MGVRVSVDSQVCGVVQAACSPILTELPSIITLIDPTLSTSQTPADLAANCTDADASTLCRTNIGVGEHFSAGLATSATEPAAASGETAATASYRRKQVTKVVIRTSSTTGWLSRRLKVTIGGALCGYTPRTTFDS